MSCEELREQLPDYTLGTLSETETAAVRRHLRGCSACRTEAALLDEGVAMFASAAHELPPPPGLKDRVLGVLAEEWQETEQPGRPLRRLAVSWPAMAAAVVVLAAALAWGGYSMARAHQVGEDAQSYRGFLTALGGLDVRAGILRATSTMAIDGSATVYDSDEGQSWALVLVRAPGYEGKLFATLSSPRGQDIRLFPIQVGQDGNGAAWLVTAARLTNYRTVRVAAPDGHVVATVTVTGE